MKQYVGSAPYCKYYSSKPNKNSEICSLPFKRQIFHIDIHSRLVRKSSNYTWRWPGTTSMFGNKREVQEPLRGNAEPSDADVGWIEMKDENDPDEDEIPMSTGAVAMSAPSLRRPRQTGVTVLKYKVTILKYYYTIHKTQNQIPAQRVIWK
eukprot:g14592.t1